MIQDELLTVEEFADHVRASQQTVRRWIKQGRVNGFTIGFRLLIPMSELSACLNPASNPKAVVQDEMQRRQQRNANGTMGARLVSDKTVPVPAPAERCTACGAPLKESSAQQ